MHEMILCKLGEVVLKGLNRRSFEDKLMSNVNRRVSKCGNFRVYSKQSTIYVEPKDDECDIEAAFESCKKVFGIIAVSKALPCEKDIQKIIAAAKEYLACDMRTARSFKVESKRADKTFPLTSIQISQQVGGALHQAFPTCEVNVHDPELVVHIEIRDDAAYVHGPAEEGAGGLPIGMGAETAQQAALVLPDIPEFTPQELMAMEKATTGLYLTGHPMDAYRSLVRSSGAAAIGRVMEDFAQEAGPTTFSDGQKISLAGVVTASKTKMTKKNTLMAYVTLEDGTGAIEMLCFTRALEQYGSYLQEGQVIYVTGTLSVRDEKAPQLMCDFARPLNANFSTGTVAHAQAQQQQRTGQTLYLRLPSVDGPEMAILRKILYMFEGKENNVRIRVLDTGKLIGTTCDLHTSLVCDLEERFGKENVVVK